MELYLMEADMELMIVKACEPPDVDDLLWATRGGFDWPEDRHVKISVRGETKNSVIYADHAYFGALLPLCLSPEAQKSLQKVCAKTGYFVDTNLSVPTNETEELYRLFFCTEFVEGINLDKSEFRTFPDGRIMRVYRHSINEEAIVGKSIFKLNNALRNETFVTGEVKSLIEEAKLVGFLFSKIWSSEEGSFDTRHTSPYVNFADKRKVRRLVSIKRQMAKKTLAARSTMQ